MNVQQIPNSRTGSGFEPAGARLGGQEYLIRVALPAEVLMAVDTAMQPLQQQLSKNQVRLAKPMLNIARFFAREEMEVTLLRWLNRIVGNQSGFRYAFNNYGSLPGMPLYWRVQEEAGFKKLAESMRVLDGWLQGNGCGSMQLMHHPRLVLIDELAPAIERKVLMEYSGDCNRMELELRELELVVIDPVLEELRLVCRLPVMPGNYSRENNNLY